MFPAKACENLDTNSQVVFAWLCFFANEDGECFPSISTLVGKTKLSKNTVKKSLNALKEKEILEIIWRKHKNSFTSNLYKIKVGQEMTNIGEDMTYLGQQMTEGVGQEMDINQKNIINQNHLRIKDKSSASKKDNIPYEKIRELFNSTVAHSESNVPVCRKLDDSRKKHVKARWTGDLKTIEEWEDFFKRISKSTWLMNARTTSFDWVINPTNCLKILEDKYSDARNQK